MSDKRIAEPYRAPRWSGSTAARCPMAIGVPNDRRAGRATENAMMPATWPRPAGPRALAARGPESAARSVGSNEAPERSATEPRRAEASVALERPLDLKQRPLETGKSSNPREYEPDDESEPILNRVSARKVRMPTGEGLQEWPARQ
jgi:hypothetical protein